MYSYPTSWLAGVAQTQRNPSPAPIDGHWCRFFADVAMTTPSKQSQAYYDLIVSEDLRWHRHTLYDVCMTPSTDSESSEWGPAGNPQVLAPLILMWTVNPPDPQHPDYAQAYTGDEEWYRDAHTSVGISMGITALTAQQNGFATGFCACVQIPLLKTAMTQRGIERDRWISPQILAISRDEGRANRQHPLQPGRTFRSSVKWPRSVTYIDHQGQLHHDTYGDGDER